MPPGLTHQNKHNNKNRNKPSKELILAENGEKYGRINKPLGDCRFEITLSNGEIIIGILRGAISRKTRIAKDNLVLVQQDISTTSKKKYFIIHKYLPQDEKRLDNLKELCDTKSTDVILGDDEDDDTIDINIDEI